jgi:hypothetical protein
LVLIATGGTMSDTLDFASRFKRPHAFGQMLEPQRSPRWVYRGIRNGSIIAVDDPNLPITVDVEATYRRWSQEGQPRLQRRQGRRASSGAKRDG